MPSPTPSVACLLLLAGAALLPACGGGGSTGGGGGGCGGDAGGDCVVGTGVPMTVEGTVRYERLVLSLSGLGPSIQTRPARFVDVEVRVAGGVTCYGHGSTDAFGAYSLVVAPPAGTQLEVVAWSRTDDDPLRNVTVHQGAAPFTDSHCGGSVFRHPSPPFASGADVTADFTVPYNPGTSSRPSIGFGILDVLVGVSEAIRTATGVTPPLCRAYTLLGNNGLVGTTYYDPASNAITVLGGAAGNLDGSDTDYFDDGVLAHEYHHFVEFRLAHSLNRGGSHGGEDLEPPFAWSEGMCTGLGCLARGTPAYVDSFGTSGAVLFTLDLENVFQSVRGIGSEQSVQEVLWDLGDGVPGLPSPDGDVAALPLGDLYGSLFTFDPAADAPYLGLFLTRLVSRGSIASGTVGTLLATPEDQQVAWPLAGADVWPLPLGIPGTASGGCDSELGPNVNPCRGRLSSAWYVLTLPSARTVDVILDVQPIVGVPNGDLDLSVLRIDGTVLRTSTNPGTLDESILGLSLPAGRYLVLVEADCAGLGNRADFSLSVDG